MNIVSIVKSRVSIFHYNVDDTRNVCIYLFVTPPKVGLNQIVGKKVEQQNKTTSAKYFIQRTIFTLVHVHYNNLPKVRHSGPGLPVRFLIASRTGSMSTSSSLQYHLP